jgi:hypothetical protein
MLFDCYRAGFGEFFCSRDGTESTRPHPSPTSYFKTATTELHSEKLIAAILLFGNSVEEFFNSLLAKYSLLHSWLPIALARTLFGGASFSPP